MGRERDNNWVEVPARRYRNVCEKKTRFLWSRINEVYLELKKLVLWQHVSRLAGINISSDNFPVLQHVHIPALVCREINGPLHLTLSSNVGL